jgi:hypothetical protein
MIQHAEVFLQKVEFDTSQTGMWLHVLFALYVINALRTFKSANRRLEKRLQELAPQLPENHQFLHVREEQLHSYRVSNSSYNVPKVFPLELEKYVGAPSVAQMAQWILELSTAEGAAFLDIKRAITASAAIHGGRIPKVLHFIDDRTKALWLRLKFDLELKNVDLAYIEHQVTNARISPDWVDTRVDEEKLRLIQRELPKVGALVLQYSEKGDFPCFSTFLRILTGYRDLSKEKVLTPSVVQSLVTTYAEKSGFKVPASYIQCDSLTLQLCGAKCPDAVTE